MERLAKRLIRFAANETPPQMLLFHATWCHHCTAMQAAWHEAAAQTQGKVEWIAVDCSNRNHPLMHEYDIRSFPSVFKVRGGARTEYRGDRTAESLAAFAGDTTI